MRVRVVLVLVAASIAGGWNLGCGSPGGAVLVAETPPAGWADDILAARGQRDADFASDPDSPIPPADRGAFRGLDYWPPDPAYRFVGEIHPYPPSEPFEIITTTGRARPCVRHGWVSFELGGQRWNLQVYRLLDSPEAADPIDELFLPFTDRTTGKETYPAGRYVPLSEDERGRIVVDFNRAHNPLCAYGMPERYACPVTPAENRLAVRIEAGERGFRGAHGS